ncbi:hypothetical protein LshimejAT787_0606310 [Lyophyllum shimeji]|uniref:BTB domain-containing protein n=1 Tax=Lyophyllum shimeji TaxID=47721 RepID=A0A9P3PQ00_LYOSH|nr:hypothetical protein LshimejAT787_0606310 [Lyophyllum shimeji]
MTDVSFAANPDITFRSSDGVLFHIHKIHLQVEAGGFAPTEFHAPGEVVSLTEDSATLNILFKFLYPACRAANSLESIDPGLLETVAEAAEKYEVYTAMDVCYARLGEALPAEAYRIMIFAYKHENHELLDKAAVALLAHPFEEVMKKLPRDLAVHWALYYDTWSRLQRKACTWHATEYKWRCKSSQCVNIMRDMGEDVLVVMSAELIAKLTEAHGNKGGSWTDYVKKKSENIPKFSSFFK